MKTAKAVIGAGYGDEGKGLLVDILAHQSSDPIVVRSNGGAQAGHTVTTSDGRRHIFHHMGAGALAGARTHFSRFFVAHPTMFLAEREDVANLNGVAEASTDPRSIITTPFDVLINQIIEEARNIGRHGSCGMGFGESIERHENGFKVRAIDLMKPNLRDKMVEIRDVWLPQRLARLGVDGVPERFAHILASDVVIENFVAECEAYISMVRLMPDSKLGAAGNVIFEGAQGLMLDQDYGVFPHVTRSNTGARNMAAIGEEAEIDCIEATYVTRAYRTRHGAGPLPGEKAGLANIEAIDATNIPNPWQGTIRYADLDTKVLSDAIRHDTRKAEGAKILPSLAVTCLDQAKGTISFDAEGWKTKVDPKIFAALAARIVGLPLHGESWGPTRETYRHA